MRQSARPGLLACAVFVAATAGAQALEPELIERLPGAIDDHTLIMLDDGHAMVAWERDDGIAHETVWASRRAGSERWSVPEIVEFSQGHARSVQLAVDASGAVTAVWVQDELALNGLWFNRYVPGEGWREPRRIEPVGGELYAPRLAVDGRGRGFAVWERRRDGRLNVRASRYLPDEGWQPPQRIDAGGDDAVSPQLAVHATGKAVVAWTSRNADGERRVVATRFVADSGWDAPRTISAAGEDGYDVRIALDAAGNVFAVWEQDLHGEETVVASRFEPGSGWSPPVQLEVDGEEAYGPQLAVSPDGSAMVVWIRAEGETGVIAAARFTREGGWQRPVLVQVGDLLYVFDLHIAGDAKGDVLAAWCQTDGSRNNVWYARFGPGEQWSRALLAEHRTGSAHRPRAAAAPEGGFGLVWKIVDAPLPHQALYSLWFRSVR